MRRRAAVVARWPLLALLLVGSATIVVLWFTVAQPLGESDQYDGGRYVEGIVGQPQRINPLLANLNNTDQDIARLVFSGLTRLSPSGKILPDLAQSWDISTDGRTYTFHLRPDVRWHNGDLLTASDIVFTYTLLAGPDFPGDPELGQFWQQVNCEEVDGLTVLCTLPAPYAPLLSFTTIGIVPEKPLEGILAADLLEHPFNQAPIGTGPFRLVDIDETRALLQRHNAYHLTTPLTTPQIKEVELRFYPDEHTAMTAFHRDEIQGLLLSANVSRDDLGTLASRQDVRVFSANGTAYTVLYLNNNSPPFSDRQVRRALALAIDRDAIISAFLDGVAIRSDSPFAPGTWAYDTELQPIAHDTDEARKLLEQAGWSQPEEGDGPRQKQGVDLQFSILTDSDPLRKAIAQEVADQLKEVGIAASVVSLGVTELLQNFLLPREYEAAIFGWDTGNDPDPYPAWHSSQIGEEGRNLANYVSANADKIMEQARKTTKLERRQSLYFEFQEIFAADAPSVVIYYPLHNYFVHNSVQGVSPGILFDTAARFANIQEWTIQEKELSSS